jgi:phosphatidylethanolamine-binding protein (PEBP) family uncharacterized protein
MFSQTGAATAFEFSFDWGGIKKCTSGNPSSVPNPIFKLSGVPDGTAEIRFKMTDTDVPSYNHGGGKVAYSGAKTIEPGTFKYKSPCPPFGSHDYRWDATAVDAKGKKIGFAKATKSYP